MTDVKKNIVYNKNYNLKLDTYIPESNSNKTIIVIHGGAWVRGSKDNEEDVGFYLSEMGFNVIIPNYRLAPEYKYPSPLEDMDNVINWIKENNFNNNLTVIGFSVGGNMAVELSIKYGIPSVSLSGIFDIDDWLQEHSKIEPKETQIKINNTTDSGEDNSFYKWFILNYLNNINESSNATPYHRISDSTGEMLLINSLDELVPMSGINKISDKLNKLKRPYEIKAIPGNRHAKKYINDVWPNIINFINSNSKKKD